MFIINVIIDFDIDFNCYYLDWVYYELFIFIYYVIEEVGFLFFIFGSCFVFYCIV